MRLAILFSGQGSQQQRHVTFLQEHAPTDWTPTLTQELPDFWNHPEPPPLTTNQIAQPLITALQLLRWQLLSPELPLPCCVAGYSIGEVSACSVAGAFSSLHAIEYSHQRAKLMDSQTDQEWSMIAVLGLQEAQTLNIAKTYNLLLSIRNTPNHLIFTGQPNQCLQATQDFLDIGASRIVPISVKVPSHTRLLSQAANDFLTFLQHREFSETPSRLTIPLLSAVDGRSHILKENVLKALAKQIAMPLDWSVCMDILEEMQPQCVLEIGPGNALARMFSERYPHIPARSVDDFQHLEGVVNWIKSF